MDLLEVFEDSDDLVKFSDGTVIFENGAEGDFMYIVMKGEIQLTLKNKPLGKVLAGDILGEMALLDSSRRSATATAISDCVLVPIDQHSFKMLIQYRPEFALHVLNVLADRLRAKNEKATL
jgi:CRP-like cAMP-binding protein